MDILQIISSLTVKPTYCDDFKKSQDHQRQSSSIVVYQLEKVETALELEKSKKKKVYCQNKVITLSI